MYSDVSPPAPRMTRVGDPGTPRWPLRRSRRARPPRCRARHRVQRHRRSSRDRSCVPPARRDLHHPVVPRVGDEQVPGRVNVDPCRVIEQRLAVAVPFEPDSPRPRCHCPRPCTHPRRSSRSPTASPTTRGSPRPGSRCVSAMYTFAAVERRRRPAVHRRRRRRRRPARYQLPARRPCRYRPAPVRLADSQVAQLSVHPYPSGPGVPGGTGSAARCAAPAPRHRSG